VVRRFEICAEHLPADLTLLRGAALLDGADTIQVCPLSVAVSASCTLLAHIVDTLTYTDDRELLASLLGGIRGRHRHAHTHAHHAKAVLNLHIQEIAEHFFIRMMSDVFSRF
jgi:hypothetical protein